MNAAVVIPTDHGGDQYRAAAVAFVARWWAHHFPGLPIVYGECGETSWSKGRAVARGIDQLSGDVRTLVIADADSFLFHPLPMADALKAVERGSADWAVPHGRVYRLNRKETDRLYSDPKAIPRLGAVHRSPYFGIQGGGFTVVTRDAFDTVGGIDARFLGWGGEDLAFGWALTTLVGKPATFEGKLVHLWHPHPAPSLRGSAESEALVEQYRLARGLPDRMRAAIAGADWTPPDRLSEPLRFRMMANRKHARIATGELITFHNGVIETDDPELAALLRQLPNVREEIRR